MTFYRFMMRNYRGSDTPEGDLAHDMELVRERFPKNGKGKYDGWHKLIREHLEWNNACSDCLAAFERCWKEYVECEKSKSNRSLCRQ